MSELSGRFALSDLLECAGLARSTYYYALAHPKKPTRPELWDAAREIFSRTPNGCGHRQIAMCLRAERGAVVADKTVLKMMGEMGLRCGIRRETVSVNIFFTISTNIFSPIAPSLFRRSRQRGCAASG